MFGAFDPARFRRPCKRAANSTKAPIPICSTRVTAGERLPQLSPRKHSLVGSASNLRDLVSEDLSELFTPAQRSWRWRTSCFIMERLRRHASAALRVLAEESSPSGAPKPDSVDRKRRLLARTQIWKGGGRISARYLTERTRSLKPHGSILSSTRVGGNMD